ncbi:AGAP001115-PA-like protein [Anopheles sinensis]|uniref:AGAP001115-PA-like protein n=1 Tax=Anopheles sinensis TaxID=74873 RepID=A0A084W087_ANOSI|nr:AGAP001115-PA-like protein [Anopheles sinensis]
MSAVFTILAICNVLANAVPILKALAIIYSATTMFFTLHFLLVIQLGSDLKKEGKITAVLVHKAINQSWKTPAAVERLLLFSRYLQHQTPVVSCGLFCFDWTLVLSVSGN